MRKLTRAEAATLRLNRRDLRKAIKAIEVISEEIGGCCGHARHFEEGCPVCELEKKFDDLTAESRALAAKYDNFLEHGPMP